MSFTTSCKNIRLDGSVLYATSDNVDGDSIDSCLDLNHHIDNTDGRFQWGGGNFMGSAQNVRVELVSDDMTKLVADLQNSDGDWVYSEIVLDERIRNENGCLVLV